MCYLIIWDFIDVNDGFCPCGRVIKQIRMSGHPSEALEIRAFSIFGGVQRWGVFKGVQRGVHEDEHGGVQGCSGGVHGQECSSFVRLTSDIPH